MRYEDVVGQGPTVAFCSSRISDLYTDSSLTTPIDATTRRLPGQSLYADCPGPANTTSL